MVKKFRIIWLKIYNKLDISYYEYGLNISYIYWARMFWVSILIFHLERPFGLNIILIRK